MKDEQTRLAIEALKAAGCGVLAIHVESRIAELEKDAARLDWMINEQAFMEYERDNYWLVFTDGSEQKQSHNSARQAIDTAMQSEKGGL